MTTRAQYLLRPGDDGSRVAWARWEGFGPLWVCWGFDGQRRWFSIGPFTVTL